MLFRSPKLKEIIIDFRYEINSSDNESYNIAELPEHLLTHFPKATSCVTSQKISFHLKNISGFDIQNPIFSVRIPRTCLHPSQDGKILECRTNLFNNQNGLSQFDFIDDFIISNNSLPYWNNNEEFILWLRLIINHNDNNELKISINCTKDRKSVV